MAFLTTSKNFRAEFGSNVFLFQNFWNWTRIFFLRLALLAASSAIWGIEDVRAQNVSQEYEIKAVFLFHFAQFTDWPTNAFESPDSPFVIGVLGEDPFGGMLESTVRNESLAGRKFIVKHFSSVEEVRECQILFISQSESKHLSKIISELKNRPVLTASDIENSGRRGACIHFFTENDKIRLRVNMDSLNAAGLVVSSKLLRVAEVIPPEKK